MARKQTRMTTGYGRDKSPLYRDLGDMEQGRQARWVFQSDYLRTRTGLTAGQARTRLAFVLGT